MARKLVVIGAGMASGRMLEHLFDMAPGQWDVTLFNAEPRGNYNRLMLIATGLIALSVGVVATVIGNLPFLGLIVPNIVSMFRGDDLRSNLPWVCLIGMATILISDLISRTIIRPFELPVSLILGTVGAAVFIIILLRRRKTGGVR